MFPITECIILTCRVCRVLTRHRILGPWERGVGDMPPLKGCRPGESRVWCGWGDIDRAGSGVRHPRELGTGIIFLDFRQTVIRQKTDVASVVHLKGS